MAKETEEDAKKAAAKKAKDRLVKLAKSNPPAQDLQARLDRVEAIIELGR